MRISLRAAVGVCVMVGASGCGGSPGRDVASCESAIRWHDQLYVAAPLPVQPRGGSLRDKARTVTCGGEGQAAVAVRRIRDVPLNMGVIAGSRRVAFLVPGFFPQLPSHPLHRIAARRLGFLTDCRGGFRASGRVRSPIDLSGFRLKQGSHTLTVQVRRQSRIRGYSRGGQPFLAPGDLVEVDGTFCRDPDAGRVRVVRDLRPAR